MVAEWRDFDGRPVPKQDACQVEVNEYDAHDRLLVTTHAVVNEEGGIGWPGRTDRAPWSDGRFTDELWGAKLISRRWWSRLLGKLVPGSR
jgi:hypothetical protein